MKLTPIYLALSQLCYALHGIGLNQSNLSTKARVKLQFFEPEVDNGYSKSGRIRRSLIPTPDDLKKAITRKDKHMVELLLKKGNFDLIDYASLAISSEESGDAGIFELLLRDERWKTSGSGEQVQQIFYEAIENKVLLHNIELLLEDPRIDLNDDIFEPFYLAAKKDRIDIVELLVLDPRSDIRTLSKVGK